MTARPPADAALATLAPTGVLHVDNDDVAIDVRCLCTAVLVRGLHTPAGLLIVRRTYVPPTPAQLRGKETGHWTGGERHAARVIHTPEGSHVADRYSTQVGWWEEPSWFDQWDLSPSLCRCGLTLVPDRLPEMFKAHRGGRVLPLPRNMLLSPTEWREKVGQQHQAMVDEALARRTAREHAESAESGNQGKSE